MQSLKIQFTLGIAGEIVYKNLFASLYLSIFDPDTIQGEE